MLSLIWLTLAFTLAHAVPTPSPPLQIRASSSQVPHGLSNVHLTWSQDSPQTISRRHAWHERTLDVVYGSCSDDADDATVRDIIASSQIREGDELPSRAVWTVREDLPPHGCLAARVDGEVIARSEPLSVVENEREVKRRKRAEKMQDMDSFGL